MQPPKPRIISLEPISRRSKSSKKSSKSKSKSDPESVVSQENSEGSRPKSANSPAPAESASQRGSGEHARAPKSPHNSDGRSEASGESVVSSSTGMSFRLAQPPSSRSARESQGDRSSSSGTSGTITATIELLKAGCLPGDSIPLKISIQHTKRIKSMHGIIITLYRQGRIDSAPPLSMFTDIKGKAAEKLKHEEYYPKSKTGLGGLSLSSAGSSSVFRKDLSQTFAPIIIDPTTLSTVVNSSIRVPEDVFPTIVGVPGQMISFRYHIEVVVDLGGKLAGTSRHLPKLGMMNVQSNFADTNNQLLGRENGSASMLAAWGGSIVDTDHIRREKSVVACLFEIIVGTTDSVRVRRRRNTDLDQPVETPRSDIFRNEIPEEEDAEHNYTHDGSHDQNYTYDHTYDHASQYPEQHREIEGSHIGGSYDYAYSETHGTTHQPYQQQPSYEQAYVPPPEIHPEEELTEKERIRRAEQRLLPSQPPQEDGPSSAAGTAPTAPLDPNGVEYSTGESSWQSPAESVTPRATPSQFPIPLISESANTPSAPSSEQITQQDTAVEDKQELERRRLMAEASSPSDFPDDQEVAGEGSTTVLHEPSAPVLIEDDGFGEHYPEHVTAESSAQGRGHDESLPKYER
jgi:hypothetical protein